MAGEAPRFTLTGDASDPRALAAAAESACADMVAACPGLRSVTCVFDWRGDGNDAGDLPTGVWVGEGGVPASPDAVFGSLLQTLRTARVQFDAAAAATDGLLGEAAGALRSRLEAHGREGEVPAGRAAEAAGEAAPA